MGTTTSVTDKRNPALWDHVFIHMEGAGSAADEVYLAKMIRS